MNWRDHLPEVRGRLLLDAPLAPYTWFRVGGPADVLFLPADVSDLSAFLAALSPDVPVTPLGVGSNVIIRDGGLEGVVVRLAGRAFGEIHIEAEDCRVAADAGALDSALARASARAGVGGLEFYAGIPGAVGGALTMNAGCYGTETRDVLEVAWGLDRTGAQRAFTVADFGYDYRSSALSDGSIIWLGAVFRGTPADPAAIEARMAEITSRRESTQPTREKTGGSTFKNPPGESAWKLIDKAGWRGRAVGGAMFSPLHANFMINTGEATAADLETLGERVRADVAEETGVVLEWEIKRIGRPA
jgi:UDP-N-acetylmuramate dehydrogenase